MRFNVWYLGNGFSLWIESIVDLAVLREVFITEEYKWQLPQTPKVILDLGAHFGDTALYYHFTYPEAIIVAVEPAPDTFARLCKNVKDIPNILPLQAAVSNKNGFADLHVSASSIGASFSSRKDTTQVISVPVFTLQTILEMHHLKRADLIKFDIEGAEEMLFIHESPSTMSDAYIGEVHGDLMSTDIQEFMLRFKDFVVKTEVQSNVKRVIIKCIKK